MIKKWDEWGMGDGKYRCNSLLCRTLSSTSLDESDELKGSCIKTTTYQSSECSTWSWDWGYWNCCEWVSHIIGLQWSTQHLTRVAPGSDRTGVPASLTSAIECPIWWLKPDGHGLKDYLPSEVREWRVFWSARSPGWTTPFDLRCPPYIKCKSIKYTRLRPFRSFECLRRGWGILVLEQQELVSKNHPYSQ